MQEQSVKSKNSIFKRLFFSKTLLSKSKSVQIAYVAVATAFVSATNMFFEFKFLDVQFSLTLAVSALVGIFLGGALGFCACFLGDLVGFLYHSAGFAYLPWVGISLGIVSLISGVLINSIKSGSSLTLYLKIALVCVLTFLICTIGINTTAFWILYSKVDFLTYAITRLFLQGQFYNSLFNWLILFIVVPALRSIKPLSVYFE